MKKQTNEEEGRRPSATFRVGAIALVFLIIGYQLALFVYKASVTAVVAHRDRPDTVYVVDPALARRLLSDAGMAGQAGHDENGPASVIPGSTGDLDYILEPSAAELLEDLLPKSLRLKFYTALLDSNASEHAARTVAMQTATDNGEDLLQELTLQYNKGRQQKITSEILDLAGGSQEK